MNQSGSIPYFPTPDPFLNIRVHNMDCQPSLSALCVGYERGEWRAQQLSDHVMDWLPEFALTASECATLSHQNATKLMRCAAKRVYDSDKFRNRGEFGEILLHVAIRQVFNSVPAVSKIYYKSANNDTVKGFDAVHVVGPPDDLELWLGEAKFYSDISRAISDVITELQTHTETHYLRDEFALIINKIDPRWPHAEILRKLLQPEVSLDEVFKRVCIPILLTYDSPCLDGHKACDAAYAKAFEHEINKNYVAFASRNLPKEVMVHLFLFPLHRKEILVKIFDEKLKLWQRL